MSRAFAAAFLLLSALPAHADPPWFDSAVAGWDENVRNAESIEWVKFKDENGGDRTLFYRSADVKAWPDLGKTVDLDAPLFYFPLDPAPRVEKRRMRVQVGFYPDRFEDRDIDLAVFEKNLVSAYFVRGVSHDGVIVGRRDRPELRIQTSLSGWWPMYSGLFPNHENVNGLFVNGRVQLYKPTGVQPAASTPLSALVYNASCRGVEDLWEKPSPEAWSQIYRGWLPQEFEFWLAPLDGPVSTPGIWTPLHSEAEKQIKETGSFDKAAQYHDWFRQAAAGSVAAVIAAAPSAPADHLTPQESRFVVCRMRRLGPDAEKELFKRAAAAGDGKAFTAHWRKFVVAELKAYQEEVKSVPRLPRIPDHKASNAALLQRTRDAFAGSTPGASMPQSRQGEPERRQQQRRIEDGGKSILDRIK